MGTHGSRLYKKDWIKYRPQDLSVIKRMWQDIFNKTFRSDNKIPLEELIRVEVGKTNYLDASRAARSERYFKGKKVYHVNTSGHPVEIPKGFRRQLVILALHHSGCTYSVEGDKVYIPPLPKA